MSECQGAVALLESYLEGAAPSQQQLDAALRHVGACARCRGRLARLGAALAEGWRDQLTCGECAERLPSFMASGGKERRVARHLATCPHCAALYAELRALEDLAATAPPAPATPRPNLAFLRPAPQPGWAVQLGQLVVSLGGLLGPGGLAPLPAPAGLRAGEPGPAGLRVDEAAPDLRVAVTADRDRGDPGRCTITVEVVIPSRGGWPNLAGSRVTLRRGDQDLASAETDPFGKAVFRGVAVADLAGMAVAVVLQ